MTGLGVFPSAGGLGGRRSRTRWVGRAVILEQVPEAPQWCRYLALTVSMLGLQLVWSCEMAQASPYLLSLGLSKSMMAIVFLAGPLSGLIVQPVVGVLSDGCKSSLGRRRPFIIGGCIVSSIAVLLLGWTKEVAAWFTVSGGSWHSRLTIALAISSVYVIDFSINVVQAMDRSLLVDVIPPDLQPAANAWASRMFGFGAVFGYWVGGIDLVWLTRGVLGDNQLKVLTFFTSFFLCACHAITIVCVKERVLISKDDDGIDGGEKSTMHELGEIWTTLRTLPKPIQQVLNVQFASWIGWFPILFFSSTWVAEIYAKNNWGDSDLASAPGAIREDATRAGTRAMLYHSLLSFFTSIFLPPLIASPSEEESQATSPYISHHPPATSTFESLLHKLRLVLPTIPFKWLSLPLLWTLSNAIFAILLLLTYLATSVASSSAIIAGTGFCWAVTNWAPFSILGELILRSPPRKGDLTPIMLHDRTHIDEWEPSALSPIPEDEDQYDSPQKRHPKSPHPDLHIKTAPSDVQASANLPKEHTSYHGPGDSTPPTPSEAYFDTSMDTPKRKFYDSRSPASSVPVSPERRTRASSQASSLHFPPDNGFSRSEGNNVFDFESELSNLRREDPYLRHEYYDNDEVGGSSSTVNLNRTPTILQIRHSDSFDRSDDERPNFTNLRKGNGETDGMGLGVEANEHEANGAYLPHITYNADDQAGNDWQDEQDGQELGDDDNNGADQAGLILGCHNIYLVLPQFLVTAISSIIFALFAPHHSVIGSGGHGHPVAAVPATPTITNSSQSTTEGMLDTLGDLMIRLAVRQASEDIDTIGQTPPLRGSDSGWDALGMIFRIGGIAAAISTYLCWKMLRHSRRSAATNLLSNRRNFRPHNSR